VFENRVLRRICGPKTDEVTGEWRELRNEELNEQHYSSNIIRVIKSRRMRLAGYVTHMGERRGAYRVLVGNPEGRRPVEGDRCSWELNVDIDPQEVGWGLVWIDLAQDRDRCGAFANAVMNLHIPQNAGNLTS